MTTLQFTLVCDGSSDEALIPILECLIALHAIHRFEFPPINPFHSSQPLADRIREALRRYPCNILFIHRDAEAQGRSQRLDEIARTLVEFNPLPLPTHVPVIPVRMTEAWLLLDEKAIRWAAGNPNGDVDLNLPRPRDVESHPDPKQCLHDALRDACGLSGRRRKAFKPHDVTRLRIIAERLEDFSALRQLRAFQELENDLGAVLSRLLSE